MKAIYILQHGPTADLKVSDVPKPAISGDEVLVKVEAAGINPSDVGSVLGRFPGSVLPRIVGRDFAGTVEDGPADLIGTEVWGSGGDLGITRNGTHAEYIVIPRQAVTRRPQKLSVEEASIAGVPFITAFSAMFSLGQLKEGEWVIVSGAAGGVGQAAIQLANAKGGRVVALIKDANELWVSKSPGVEAVAQSDRVDLEDVVRRATNGEGANLALNGVGSSIFGAVLGALAVGGRQVVYSTVAGREFTLDLQSLYKNQFKLFGLDTQKLDAARCASILSEIGPLFDSGALQPPVIGERYPLSAVAKAYDRVASGKGGKIVFVMSADEKTVAGTTATRNSGNRD